MPRVPGDKRCLRRNFSTTPPDHEVRENHRCKNPDKSLKEKCHIIEIEENTLLKEIIGEDEIWVTSNHHQAVDEVGRNLRVAARSPAGVIEAIEWHDKSYFCIGLQPHPEVTENSKLNAVFREFKRAVLRYAMSRNEEVEVPQNRGMH